MPSRRLALPPSRSRTAWRALRTAFACAGALGAAASAAAQELPWQAGPMTAPIGDSLAQIEVAEGFLYLDKSGTEQLLELTENVVGGNELATLAPISESENWFLIFEWEDIGYVPDDEKESLDAEAMLDSIQRGNEAANEVRRERGWTTMEIVGWHEAPFYDDSTQNLTWSIIGRSEGHDVVNRFVKLLGRKGVMTVTLVADPSELTAAVPTVDRMLTAYEFVPGQTYAEYVPGTDKLAEYGLTALVVGGGAAALAKAGFFTRFWKLIVAGVVAVGGGLSRLFSRKSEQGPTLPA